MAAKIRLLPEHVINVIAAGEVIENPASVVKELVENSIDAGATHIEVECLAGGFQKIQIDDNGSGMSPDDALLCLERHATSKLKNASDLLLLTSMGFRGEALASIAAISRMTLSTAREESIGTQVICEGGKILTVQKCAREKGTTIEIQNLFYNVPARKKFQKSPSSSQAEIGKLMTKLAIGFPQISFTFKANGATLLSTKGSHLTGSEQMQTRIKEILGEDFVNNMVPLHFEKEGVSLRGYVGRPFRGKHNRSGELLYINQRAVVSQFVEESIQRAYGHSLDSKQFPIFVLHLNIPTHLVDVNVHPQKREVRFQDELWLDMIIKEAITEALGYRYFVSQSENHQEIQKSSFLVETPITREINWEMPQTKLESISTSVQHFSFPHRLSYVFRNIGFLPASEDLLLLFSSEGSSTSLVWVDLKSLYQRVLYDACLDRLMDHALHFSMQKLLFPIPLSLSYEYELDFSILHQTFASLGIVLRQLSNQQIEVEAIASHISEEEISSYIEEGLKMIHEYGNGFLLSLEAKEGMARLFVKKSRSKEISLNEANQLLEQYFQRKRIQYSPFGEPIFALLGDYEIQQIFRAYQESPNADEKGPSRPAVDRTP